MGRLEMAAVPDESESPAPPPLEASEKKILDEQVHFEQIEASFFSLYQYATFWDLALVLASAFAAIIAGALHPTAPIVNSYLVEYLARARTEGDAVAALIHRFTWYYVYIFFISLTSWTIATSGFIHTASRISQRIKSQYFAAVLRQNIAVFDDDGTADLLSHLTSNTIQDALSSKLAISIAAIGNLMGTIVVCFALDWMLACILSWSFVLGTLFLVLSGKTTARYSKRALDASSAGTAIVEEALSAIKNTFALGLQRYVHRSYMESLRKATKHNVILKVLNSAMVSLCAASGYINVALGFWQGSRRLTEGTTPFTSVVAIAIVLKSAAFVVFNIGSNLEAFHMAAATAGRMHRLAYRVSPIELSGQGDNLDQIDGTIELQGIKLVYPFRSTTTVLDNINIFFPARKTTAIVGPSGSGKSSITDLILRFYNPVKGSISLDGKDIATLQLQWLRRTIRVVSQEPFIFSKTVYENIELALSGPRWKSMPQEKKRHLIHEACKAAQAHGFIESLPRGYDTIVGGSKLSGGQAQRLAIARAIIGQPRILILDEATSMLDSETETKVLAAIERFCTNCTKIIVAHRLSTIQDVDKIIVLRSGSIIEEGTHSELMESRSLYFDLVRTQELSHEETNELASKQTDGSHRSRHAVSTGQTNLSNGEENASFQSGKELDEIDSISPSASFLSLVRLVWRLNRPELRWMLRGLICSLLAGLEEPASAMLFGKSITALSKPLSDRDTILAETSHYSCMFFLLAMAMFVLLGAEGIIFGWCSEKMINRARGKALEKMLGMRVSFFDTSSASTLTTFLSTSTNDLAGISGAALSTNLLFLSTAVCGITVAMLYGWELTLACLLLYPLLAASGYLGTWLEGQFESHTELFNNEAAEVASEALSGIRTVAAMAGQNKLQGEFETALQAPAARALRANLQTSFLYALSQAIYYFGMVVTFRYGSKLIIRHEYSLDQFIVVQSSILMGAYSAGLVYSWTPSISKAKRASSTLQHLLSRPSAIERPLDALNCTNLEEVKGRIDFDSVTFSYPSRPGRATVKGISFSVPAGSHVAIVGPTGSGKSTIVSMIERFYDPDEGAIILDGQPVAAYNLAEYRRCIGLVSQDPTLYNGTIRFNLLAGLNDEEDKRPSDATVEEACRQANIYTFIQNLPDGLDTIVGARGTQLSVGQKQRIALARALIRRPAILLLDEATSALDAQSEALIQEALDRAKRGRTTITVSHRLSTIRKADCIYFLDQGTIVEAGTHAELMAQKGRYYSLFIAGTSRQTTV